MENNVMRDREGFFSARKLGWFLVYVLMVLGAYHIAIIAKVTWTGEMVAIAGTCYRPAPNNYDGDR